MEKLKMHTPDLTQDHIARIRELFPHCVTEARDESGKLKLAVDFDQLKQELSDSIVEGPQERYHLNWPGKREALLTANAPIAKTLRPAREESVDFDTTKNLFIEGDNLEALKLLQETYLGKVKMIYIDPPYNTGNDFIYEDDFSESSEDFKVRSNQKSEEGIPLVANPETNGRFHSDWLSMMYSRLKLARNLISEDGIIFISIDDREAYNTRSICNEIFGGGNFLGCFVWKRRSGAMDAVTNVSEDHEYVLCYSKTPSLLNGVIRSFEKYSNPDNDPRGDWILDNLSAGKPGGDTFYAIKDTKTGHEYWPPKGRYWPYSPTTMAQKIAEGRIIFPKKADGSPLLKRFKQEAKRDVLPVSTWMEAPNGTPSSQATLTTPINSVATKALKELFGDKIFSFPKPVELIKNLLGQSTDRDSLVLDFFSGSATTAHAVFSQNAQDGGNRKFIMVQLPEAIDGASEAFKAGYKNIAEISKERIRRAGKKVKEKSSLFNGDIGFRVLKIDTSNMAEVYYTPDGVKQDDLLAAVNNIKPDRSPEDLLFQVLLDWGVDLTLAIAKKTIQSKTVFFVDGNALVACFDAGITEELVKELAAEKPLRVVFRDNAFASDSVKINAEQIFKQMSPGTDMKSI